MKKAACHLLFVALLSTSLTSCLSMKKDCQGVRHTRLKNGIYL